MKLKVINAHEIYKWAMNNHGKKAIPKWNFHKILIGKMEKLKIYLYQFTNPIKKITKYYR